MIRQFARRRIVFTILLLPVSMLRANSVHGSTFVVDTTSGGSAFSSEQCVHGTLEGTPVGTPITETEARSGDSSLSLREAICLANHSADPTNTIQLPVNQEILLTTRDNAEWGYNGLPAVTSDLIIEGNGTVINRGNGVSFRFFYVAAGARLVLRQLELENGLAQGGDGGSSGAGGGGGAGLGGAVFVHGALEIVESTLVGNIAQGGAGGGPGSIDGLGGGGGAGGSGGTGGQSEILGGATLLGGGGGGGGFGGKGADGVSGGGTGGGGGGTLLPPVGDAVDDTGGQLNGGAGGASSSIGGSGGPGGGGGGGGGGLAVANGGTGGPGGGGGGGSSGGSGGFGGGGGGGINSGGGGFGGGSGGALLNVAQPGFGGGMGAVSTIGEAWGGGGAGLGGAIFNDGGSLILANATFVTNQAIGGSAIAPGTAGQGFGGAVFMLGGSLSVLHATIHGNRADDGGAVYAHAGENRVLASFSVANSILATSVRPDFPPITFSQDCVLTDTAIAAAVTISDTIIQRGTNCTGSSNAAPNLGGFAENGGPTRTVPLTPSSPALNADTTGGDCLPTDQRRVARPIGIACDLGAFELPMADISFTKQVSPETALPGDTVTYTLTVHNSGPSSASSVIIIESLPAGVTFLSSNPGCVLDPAFGATCHFSTPIPAGGTGVLTIDVRVGDLPIGTEVVNSAFANPQEFDPNTGNNGATATFTIAAAAPPAIPALDTKGLIFFALLLAIAGLAWLARSG